MNNAARRTIARGIIGVPLILALSAAAAFAQPHPMFPDPKLTPGASDPAVTQATLKQTVCNPAKTFGPNHNEDWIKQARSVSESEKHAVMLRYGLPLSELSKVEIDHDISLENGGSNALDNLWPQYYAAGNQVALGIYYGAREKDVVETRLHADLCAGRITLAEDRAMLADWLVTYKANKGIRLKP